MKKRDGVDSAVGGGADNRLPTDGTLRDQPGVGDVIARLTDDFVALSPRDSDESIVDALRELAHCTQAAGSFIIALSTDLAVASTAHEWSANPDDSLPAAFHSYPFDRCAWGAEELGRGENVVVRTLGDIPPEARRARDFIEAHGFRPLLLIPMRLAGALYGCLGFYGSIGETRDWPEASLPLLQFAANLIAERMQAGEESRDSEKHYRALFDSAAIGIGVSDERGRLLAFNDAMLRPGGHSRADIGRIGHIGALYYDPEDRDKVRALLEKQGHVDGYKVRFRRKDGTPYWASLSLAHVTFEGRPCTQALVEDITERDRDEELLQLRARQQTTVAKLGLSALAGTDLSSFMDELVTLVAQTLEVEYCGVLELLPDERALRLRAGVGWEDGLVGTAVVDAGLNSQAGFTLQSATPVIVKDLPTETRFHSPALMRDHGVVSGVSVVIAGRDRPYGVLGAHSARHHRLTEDDAQFLQAAANVLAAAIERRRVEEQLRESEARFTAFMEHLPVTAFIKDSGFRFIFVNQHVKRRYGAHAWLGRSVEDIFPKPLAERMTASDQQALQNGYAEMVETVPDADGNLRTVETHKFRIDLDDQDPLLGAFALDITERRQADEEQERLQAQLLQAQKMESVGRLAGGVAHDFNNMLEVIIGHAELAMDQLGPSHPVSSDLREIRKAAGRSADITRQLLAFARRQIVTPRVIDLNEIVAGTMKMLERLIGEGIELIWRPGADIGSVEMDPAQIDQILMNLCVNARDAVEGAGRITIETAAASIDEAFCATHPGSVTGEYVLLTVSDNGCGMDQEMQTHLFEPFFTTKETGKGTGLGLATIYGIVKQNNGFIDVWSEPGLGATFSIYLPRHAGGVVPEAEYRSATSPTLPIGKGETLLVVEDEPPVLGLIARVLTRADYRVLTAKAPSEALEVAKAYPDRIALLITDVVMPEMDGWELAKQLSSIRPDLKMLFMSGYAADIVSGREMLDREIRFMQKPFSPRDLVTAVRAAIDQA